MTVLQNVEYALKFNKETKANSRQIALNIIEAVGLKEHIFKKNLINFLVVSNNEWRLQGHSL